MVKTERDEWGYAGIPISHEQRDANNDALFAVDGTRAEDRNLHQASGFPWDAGVGARVGSGALLPFVDFIVRARDHAWVTFNIAEVKITELDAEGIADLTPAILTQFPDEELQPVPKLTPKPIEET